MLVKRRLTGERLRWVIEIVGRPPLLLEMKYIGVFACCRITLMATPSFITRCLHPNATPKGLPRIKVSLIVGKPTTQLTEFHSGTTACSHIGKQRQKLSLYRVRPTLHWKMLDEITAQFGCPPKKSKDEV